MWQLGIINYLVENYTIELEFKLEMEYKAFLSRGTYIEECTLYLL